MATKRRRRLRSLLAATLATLVLSPVLLASAATTVAFTIGDARVTESSGLTRDTRSDLYWTVNDSGDEGTVYGVTEKGTVEGIVAFRAKPKDVEAVAISGRRLYVADIGDNRSKRDFVTVYYFNDPEPNNQTVPYRSLDFSYPDGPHDAETLLVNGDGRLFLVTKGIDGAVYRAPRRPSRQGVNKLTRVADAPPYVTDGVFLPGGDRIALRTYVSVEVLDASTYKTVASAATPYQRQGESIAVALDGKSLLVGSEGKRSPVYEMAIPSQVSDTPKAGSTPPPSTKPTPTPTATASDPGAEDEPSDEDEGPPARRVGTVLALSLAGFVALVAGVVVAARKS